MADYSMFSSPEFSSSAWINALLNDSEDVSIDSVLSSVATKLHIMSQDYTDQLETSMVESMSTMPRLLSEISKIEDSLRMTDNEMRKLSQEIANFDQRNVSGVEDLSRLDTMKSNIERCKATLEEHARWSVLVREAKAQLESGGNRSQTAERIESMFRSVGILKKLPGHDHRLASCSALRDGLLSTLRPTLQSDIASADFATVKEYLYIYQKLDCDAEFEREYIASRSNGLLSLWAAPPPMDGGVARWLASNLGSVSSLVDAEEVAVVELFGFVNGKKVLQDIAVASTAPMHTILIQLLSALNSPSVSFECYCVVEEFACRLAKSLEGIGASAQLELVALLFSGLTEYLPTYVDAENAFARTHLEFLLNAVTFSSDEPKPVAAPDEDLDDLLFSSGDDPSEMLQAYLDRLVVACESFQTPLNQSMERSVQFLGGAKVKQVLRCVTTHLSWLIKQLTAKLVGLGVACGGQDLGEAGESGGNKQSLDYLSIEPRVIVTNALRAVQAAGILVRRFQEFDAHIRALLVTLSTNLLDSGVREADYVHSLLLQDPSSGELRSFLQVLAASGDQSLFASSASQALDKLQLSSCSVLFSLCLTTPRKIITGLSLEDSWSSSVHVNADNVQPQAGVIQVGEHLLSLVQEFEAFATSTALSDVLFVGTSISGLAEKSFGWQSVFAMSGLTDVALQGSVFGRDSCSQLISVVDKALQAATGLDFGQDQETGDDAERNPVLKFVNEWLGAIASEVVAGFFHQIVISKSLTGSGVIQLQTDLAYLYNVISAMGIKPHPLLNHLIQLLSFAEQRSTLLSGFPTATSQLGNNKALHFLVHFDQQVLAKLAAGH